MNKEELKNLKILYVEDDDNIRKNAVSYLNRLFNNVYEAQNASVALEIISKTTLDIMITDIKMPKTTGLELIKKIRLTNKKLQIIVLTAFTDKKYLLDAIELGLVKYLIKPIRHSTLLPLLLECASNIKANSSNILKITENASFDYFNKNLTIENKIIKLTKNELILLELVCKNYQRTVTYNEIENNIWSDSYMTEDALRSLIRNLRRKLPKNSLSNLSGLGYKISSVF